MKWILKYLSDNTLYIMLEWLNGYSWAVFDLISERKRKDMQEQLDTFYEYLRNSPYKTEDIAKHNTLLAEKLDSTGLQFEPKSLEALRKETKLGDRNDV